MQSFEAAVLTLPVSDEDHTRGSATAPVTLVEYGDFECPYCGQAYPIVEAIQQRFGDQLRFVFRNFPLTQAHPHAEHAAEAAEAASAQGAFWPMHEQLFTHQKTLDDSHLVGYASDLGLDSERVDRELAEGVHTEKVRAHFMSGIRSGVNGTPTFFINGVRHDDSYDFDTLVDAIERAALADVR
ncbi:MAG: DsbA family protein [Thermomicrobiales bacterium]|jgi:protein-disulfide isomerase